MIKGRAFHDWAWISVGWRWRVGFSRADDWKPFGWVVNEPSFKAVRIPLTLYYIGVYRRSA